MSCLLRALAVWLLIVCAESIHGVMREMFLAPRVGDFHARQISVITGSLLILGIAYLSVRWIGADRTRPLLLVGLLWLSLTLAFEFILGRYVLGLSWERLISDYQVSRGGLMPFGLVALVLAPLMAARLRARRPRPDRRQFNYGQ